jgi:hypothetical protein
MKLKGLHFADVFEIQEAVTDELKKVQKEEVQQLFRNHSFPSPYATLSAQQPLNSTPHSVQQTALLPEQSSGQPSLLPLRVLPVSATANTIDAQNYKILFRDVYIHIILIVIALILQNL